MDMRLLKIDIISGLASILLLFAIFWANLLPVPIDVLIYIVSYGMLTWFLLNYFSKSGIGNTVIWNVTLSIILGRILIELPFRISDFHATIHSLQFPVVSLLSVALTAIVWKFLYNRRGVCQRN